MPPGISAHDVDALLREAARHYGQSRPQMARDICERICNAGIDNPLVWCLLSAANIQLGLNEQALLCARRSSRLSPQYPDALVNAGAALYNLQRTDEAIDQLGKALALNPRHLAARSLLGTACIRNGDYDKAAECYRILLENNPGDINVYCRLAETHERMGREGEARDYVEQALSKDPAHAEANALAARIERINRDYTAAYRRLSRIRKLDAPLRAREMILHELGLVCDRTGRYAEAFSAFRECNEVTTQRYGGKYDYRTFIERINRYRNGISKASTAGWNRYTPRPEERKAPVFLLGFPRSGTTLTEQIMASHPSVYASDELDTVMRLTADLPAICPGVIDDFPFGLENLGDNDIRKLRAEYWNRVDRHAGPVPENARYLDKLPLNMVELGFILRIFPEAKIIFATRDPRDVCLSCFSQCFDSNIAMAAFERLDSTAELYAATMDLWLHYRNVLDPDFHESRYEELVADFESSARALIGFIGAAWDDSVLEYHAARNRRLIGTPSYHDASQPVYTRAVNRWKNYAAELQPILPVLAPYVELLGYEP